MTVSIPTKNIFGVESQIRLVYLFFPFLKEGSPLVAVYFIIFYGFDASCRIFIIL